MDLAVGRITQMVRAVRDTGAIAAKERWRDLEELATDVKKLAELVIDVDPGADLGRFFAQEDAEHEDVKDRLQFVIRGLVGLNSEEVEKAFTAFVHAFPRLTAQQIESLSLVKQHITDHGMLRIEDFYEAPFTQLHSDSVDGVFADDEQVNRLIAIIETFDPAKVQSAPLGAEESA